jgi:Flp pilus assembly pilin Flp
MNLLRFYLQYRWRWTRGQTMTEYALILAAIAVVALAAYTALGSNISTQVNNLNSDI